MISNHWLGYIFEKLIETEMSKIDWIKDIEQPPELVTYVENKSVIKLVPSFTDIRRWAFQYQLDNSVSHQWNGWNSWFIDQIGVDYRGLINKHSKFG